ncbi:MAG: hypothetical protein SGI87_05770 [Flavobacteriales bacterium]|nr:hypothetical protein [Flavobacteriales bacterium]
MKTRFTLVLFSFCLCHALLSQKQDPVIHRVITFGGEEHVGSDLRYESPILQASFFQLDDKRFETKDVYQFQNNNGFFANLAKVHGEKTERYALRTHTGKIDIYEEINMNFYGGQDILIDFPDEAVRSNHPDLANGNYAQYYVKGDLAIKKSTYKNLKADLSDHTESAGLMKRFNRMRWLQYGMLVSGAALIGAGLGTQDPEEMKMTPMVAFGIVIGGGSYLLENPKEKTIWAAIKSYND